jgi:hypothetical protein
MLLYRESRHRWDDRWSCHQERERESKRERERERERERKRDVFSMLDRKWRKYSTCGVYSLKIERRKEVRGEKTERKKKRKSERRKKKQG